MNPPQPSSAALRQLADLSDIRGDWNAAAEYRRAAGVLDSGPAHRSGGRSAAGRDLLHNVDRPGSAHELSASEVEMALRATRARIPWLLRRLIEFNVVATSEAAALARAGIVTLADLNRAAAERRIADQFGSDVDTRLRRAHKSLSDEARPVTLGRASDILEPLVARLTEACPPLEQAAAAGGVRRYEPLSDALVIVSCAADPDSAIEVIAGLPDIEDVLHRSNERLVIVYRHVEIDVHIADPATHGTALHAATGSDRHLAAVASRTATVRVCAREEEVYSAAGLPFIPPELRQGTGEIEAALAGRLPKLVALEQIRGDLHMHSTYSDGADSLESMVAASSALGYEYIAITDHSERAGAARTVTVDALARQGDELARLRERYPSIAILHGIEVDIMPDGRLDFADDVLATLDIVLASLHDDARQGARALTRRCIGAIRHPLVSIVTHPANRIVGRRAAYPLDFNALFDAAAEAGTALEIDGAPAHLDLDGEHARAAVAAGVTVVIDSDCHRASALARQMRLGVGTARRGWVEAHHVLNTRSLTDVRRFIATKRSR